MKQLISYMFFISLSMTIYAQDKPYNVVFDLTSKDTADQQKVMRWIKAITGSNPAAKMEVVLYGESLDMVTKNKSVVADGIKEMTANKNVSFVVCKAAMKRHNLDADQLIPGVATVPDGIYEIITKQGEGWGYIKVSK